MSARDQADYAFLMANARAAQALNLEGFLHLDQPIGIWNYIRIANDIEQQASGTRLLDWGCGWGQMTYLLRRRGLEVTPFDVGPAGTVLPKIPLCEGLSIVRVQEPTRLPFPTDSFDVVLSCGVLEHVEESEPPGDEMASLREIARVLHRGGAFLIYQLPQRHSWQEAIIRRFRLGYAHPRRYTADEISHMLHVSGFQVTRMRRANLVPKNLTGMPAPLRSLYSRFSRPLIVLDGALCRIPLLSRIAGVLEISAQRVPDR